ncbi:MAG: TIM barrel protein [Oscillospiraceae bacterium]|nr:TIM barrel protein [Oscillospiraceae bacterium]
MNTHPLFGPGGNPDSFYAAGLKHTREAPKWVSDFGLDVYEYQGGSGLYGSSETFRKIGEEAKQNNIVMSLHAPYYISLSGIEEEIRLKSISYIKDSVRVAKLLNAYIIVIHAGSTAKNDRKTSMDYAKDTLYKTLEALPDLNVRIGLETMGKINQLGTLEEVIELFAMDERLYPVIDFGHLNARNIGGLFQTADDYKRVFDSVKYKAQPLHCHFSKIEFTKAGEKKHLTFEDKIFGPEFEPLIEAIHSEKLSPCIICESDGTMAEDALTMKNYYKELKQKNEQT